VVCSFVVPLTRFCSLFLQKKGIESLGGMSSISDGFMETGNKEMQREIWKAG
jgi:hypothetical protein